MGIKIIININSVPPLLDATFCINHKKRSRLLRPFPAFQWITLRREGSANTPGVMPAPCLLLLGAATPWESQGEDPKPQRGAWSSHRHRVRRGATARSALPPKPRSSLGIKYRLLNWCVLLQHVFNEKAAHNSRFVGWQSPIYKSGSAR